MITSKTLSPEQVRQLFDALEHAERAVCLVNTSIVLLTDSQSFHSMGRTMLIGLHEAADELESRYQLLEETAKTLLTTQIQKQ